MTSVLANNVFNIAIEGNFDDAQAMVKASFANQGFLNGTRLVAVNSINWARIMAQIVYYVAAGVALGAPQREVSFCVPSANFGNVFAGYMAYKMGLPVKQFIMPPMPTTSCTARWRLTTSRKSSQPRWHPLWISSCRPIERLLFDAYDRDGAAGSSAERFQQEPTALADAPLAKLREKFASYRSIRTFWK